ncbi:ATP-binding cassette domain-containing protein [Sphingobacterium sp. UT-1RO-CII-1]|uniref:ABC transporter ATP-binding protein n=1 Tax=Sphingobacterium sp. UT-1RO-CII-1 TaxID=2995225 RepID=UPI00227C5F5D|nr:ATP-binding cassette domain-containing protein [Sphingobacterium sp. UT-1RO-CII-1]MCY4781378.1 ATP-binding cassette domain-containing protein [Sphingobacterium sp. UT-1RO-CII-1]
MLDIRNISKQYGQYYALNDVSLHIPRGSIFGLLGPNGAGKTSLIRIINQITAPDTGVIYLGGEPLRSNHIENIGYLPEERGLYKKMKIGEQMLYLAQLKGLRKQDALQKIKAWFIKLQIESWWDKKIEDLSKGMQQKVQFIATVIHEPELIILDEPFSGFDPVNAQIIQEEILELNKKGATIIYSTHRMESVETLCDHIALLNKSKKILDGSVREIKNAYKSQSYKIKLAQVDKSSSPILTNSKFDISSFTNFTDDYELIIKLKEDSTLNQALLEIIPQAKITHVSEIIPSMHDIFIEKVTQIKNEKN